MHHEKRVDQMTKNNKQRLTVIVSGDVQGVGYRAFVRRYALNNGITGYAENTSDGRVEIVAEGDRQELEHLLVLLKKGPTHAKVSSIEPSWGEASELKNFFIY